MSDTTENTTEYVYENEYQEENQEDTQEIDEPTLIRSLDYDSIKTYVEGLSPEDLATFKTQPYVFHVVDELVKRFTTAKNDKVVKDGLAILKLFKTLGMSVYEGETPSTTLRPANLAAGADSTIGIPILNILMEGWTRNTAIGNKSVIQADGLIRAKKAQEYPARNKAPIFSAIDQNRLKTVMFLVDQGGKVNDIYYKPGEQSPIKYSPLEYAIIVAINIDIAAFLVSRGANVNSVDSYKDPLLQNIIRNKFKWGMSMPGASPDKQNAIRLNFVKLIALDSHYSPSTDAAKQNPVQVAILQKSTEMLDILLGSSKIREQLGGYLTIPFINAVERSSYVAPRMIPSEEQTQMDTIVKYLLQRKDYKNTFFTIGILQDDPKNKFSTLDTLDEKKARIIQTRSKMIETAILSDTEMLKLLVDRKYIANDYRMDFGYNPITFAIAENKMESLRILTIYKQNKNATSLSLNETDERGRLPLVQAIINKNMEMVAFLLDNGATPNTFDDREGKTPLTEAIIQGLADIVNLLLEHGADPNQPNRWGQTPILLAIESNQQPIIDLLKAKGAKLDMLLLEAAMRGNVDLVKQFLAEGLDPTIETTVAGKQYNAYDVSPSIDVRLLFAPYYEKDEPRFAGFAKDDFEKFEQLFSGVERTAAEGTTIPAERENSLCPICHLPGRWEDGCMYLSHNCKQIQDLMQKGKEKTFLHIHEKLYAAYNENGLIKWCTHCNRLTTDPQPGSHRHYDIGPPIPIKSERPKVLGLAPGASLYAKQCYTNYGGDLPEKFARYQKLYDFMCYLNTEYIGKISANIAYNLIKEVFIDAAVPYKAFFTSGLTDPTTDEEELVVTAVLEAVEAKSLIKPAECGKFGPGVAVLAFKNAPNVPRPPTNVELKPTILKQEPFNESKLPEAPVPPVQPVRIDLPEGVTQTNVNVNDPSKFNSEKQAKLAEYKAKRSQYQKNFMAYQRATGPYRALKLAYNKKLDTLAKKCKYHNERHSDGRDLIQFHHRQTDGELYDHEDSFICKEGLVDWLNFLSMEVKTVTCFDEENCDGFIHPDEVKDLMTTPEETRIWNEYRRRFNRNPPAALVPKEGGRRHPRFRRSRKFKKVLNTRKAKRYNRTRKQ